MVAAGCAASAAAVVVAVVDGWVGVMVAREVCETAWGRVVGVAVGSSTSEPVEAKAGLAGSAFYKGGGRKSESIDFNVYPYSKTRRHST